MTTPLKWLADRVGNPVSVLTTELDSLPNNGSVLSGVIENSVTQDLYGDFELTVQFAAAPAAGYVVELYIVRTVDGVNFDDTSGGPPMNAYADVFPLRASASKLVYVIPMIELPPQNFKVYIKNSSGQAMVATNNTLKMFGYKRTAG